MVLYKHALCVYLFVCDYKFACVFIWGFTLADNFVHVCVVCVFINMYLYIHIHIYMRLDMGRWYCIYVSTYIYMCIHM